MSRINVHVVRVTGLGCFTRDIMQSSAPIQFKEIREGKYVGAGA